MNGPNPTDRAKPGSKRHLVVDSNGVSLAAKPTAAHVSDMTMLETLLEAIPPVRGKPGAPGSRPDSDQTDRGYDSDPARERLRWRGIKPQLARRNMPHGSGLGKTRYVVERALAWARQYRRLRVRYERRADIHEGFLSLARALIAWKSLMPALC
jgi:transposase